MKIKSIVTAIAIAGTFGAGAATVTQGGMLKEMAIVGQSAQSIKINSFSTGKVKTKYSTIRNKKAQVEYFNVNQHEGKKRYIIRLVDDAVTSYKGDIIGLESVNASARKSSLNNASFNPKSKQAQKYISYLEQKQTSFVAKASSKLGSSIPNLRSYKYAINGLLTELTMVDAKKVSQMSEVAFIELDKITPLNTDTGPLLIGAGNVWNGTSGSSEFRGEGIIIGMLDSGINTDHRSFASTGDDGYTVVNPWGEDVYVGDCLTNASLCNSKLIGVHSYSEITDAYSDAVFPVEDQRPANGEDYNGHGSHTASTAGGNALVDVPYMVNDFLAGNVGDGITTSYTFTNMSGVAPHANIISYQVCLPGSTGDAFSGCLEAATLAAIDDAIVDGVDIINYSIGGTTPFSPWNSSIEIAFLNAQAAGIFVATSSGNSGPAPFTTTKASPWYTSTASANHGNARVSSEGRTIGGLTGGDTTPPAEINGGGINGAFTGGIVYAGDFVNPNDPEGDPAQCLEPFPDTTFTATQIVVCDRGAIARVQKGANAAAGGAGGFVLANIQGGSDTISGDFYAVPGIHISADDGDLLKTWLATGAGHQGTISDSTLIRDTNTADQIASSSSRGPNVFSEIITPQIAAPGVSIYAAYSDDQPFGNVNPGAPVDFAFLNGTSMASPHVAGSAALMTQAHPSWNPDQIRSALMMTANNIMLKQDGATAADAYDMGAGRVQVNLALNAGLVMSESQVNYEAADPADGGDPKTLNVPSMANSSCAGACSWTRTFTAVSEGSYAFTSSTEALTMEPTSFDALVGDSVSVVFTLDVSGNNTGTNIYENVFINSAGQPELHLPVHALVNNGAVPSEVNITAGRDNGSWVVTGIQTIPTDNLNFVIDGLFDANATGLSETLDFDIPEDPTNSDYADDLEQVFVYEFTVPVNTVSINAAITVATSPDNDLFLEMNVGGSYQLVAFAATVATLESVSVAAPEAGDYRIIVQNWAGSDANSDTGTVVVNVVPQTDPVAGLTVDAPTVADGNVDAKLLWDIAMIPGDSYFADITVLAGTTEIGTFRATLDRIEDDFSSSAAQTLVARGEQIDYTIMVTPTVYNQDIEYSVSIDMPPNMTLVEGSAIVSGSDITIKDPNAVGLNLTSDFSIAEDPTNGEYRDDLEQVHVFEFEVPSGTLSLTATISGSTSPDNDLWIEFDSAGDGSYDTLVADAQTVAADETATAGAPVAGMYRAIVMNWAGSGAATDTGILTITTVPATGEGLIWGISAPGFSPLYTVVSATDNATCLAAGLGGWAGTGGYTPLSDFGVGTLGVSGDEATWSVFGDSVYNFFGEDKNGLTVSDNGFVFFSGNAGVNAWLNLPIPNESEPNDMFAGLWLDQIVVDDGNRGIRLASLGPVDIVEFDGVQPWTSTGDSTDRFYYQIQVMSDGISNDHGGFGPYEMIVSYADAQSGNISGATVGVENADGTIGFDVSSMLEEGGQLCFDYHAPPVAFEVTFSVIPTSDYLGATAAPIVTVESDMDGTEDITFRASPVELINVGPTANAGSDVTYDRADAPRQITLSASATLDLDEDSMSYKWTQVSGTSVNLFSTGAIDAFFNLNDTKNGSYTFSVEVSDGEFMSTDEVTIVIEGKEANSGSMSWLLMLLGIPLFYRRRFLK